MLARPRDASALDYAGPQATHQAAPMTERHITGYHAHVYFDATTVGQLFAK